jgi:hypothetical protein
MNIRVEDGKAVPYQVVIFSYAGADTVERLEEIDWHKTLAWAVTQEATDQRSDPDVAALLSDYSREHANMLSVHAKVSKTLRTAQRKNGVTVDRLQRVLELFEAGGIEAVTKETGKSRAYAYQLLNRARKELR